MEIKKLVQQYIYWPEVENIYQKNVDFSQVAVSDLKSLFAPDLEGQKAIIKHKIIRFYALNEMLAKLRQQENELLDEKALQLYKKYIQEMETSSKKLFTYIFFISLVEARHCLDLHDIRTISNSIERADQELISNQENKTSSKYYPLKEKNIAKFLKQKEEIDKTYGDLEYLFNHEDYDKYKKELDVINVRYRKVEKRIYHFNRKEMNLFEKQLEETLQERVQEATNEFIVNLSSKFLKQDENGEDIDIEHINKFLKLYAAMVTDGNYSHNSVYDKLKPLLEDDKFKDITISNMMKAIVNIFKFGSFEGGYGGEPWAKITEHGLNFARGSINTEVFLDQAFSLEHNNGNMFNKNIVFRNSGENYWKVMTINPKDNEDFQELHYGINDCQFFLNAQHQGQLLSFLDIDFNELDKNVGKDTLAPKLAQLQESGLIPKYMTAYGIKSMDRGIEENLQNLKQLAQDFHEENSDFKTLLKDFKVEKPVFDIYSLINGCKEGSTKIDLGEKGKLFCNLTNYQLKKYTAFTTEATINKIDYNYSFDYLDTKNIPIDKLKKETLGNKALGLAQMHEMNLPVPNALVFPTTNASGYFKEKAKWINDLRPELNKIKHYFTDVKGDPIACSVRSGSSISMPGMMDTILNVGIDDSNYDYFCKKMGKDVTNECVVKFMSLFSKSLLHEEINFSNSFPKALFQFKEVLHRHGIAQSYENKFPLNARQQYKWCLQAVFQSWHSERAVAYREHQGLSHDLGTAAIVQQMVFGNLNEKSCTGVVFSRDCISGEKGIIGEFLPKAQGEDVVSGAVTPKNIKELKDFNPTVYDELIAICEKLEKDSNEIQDIEFTVEDGKLYILQKRKAVCSSLAKVKLNQELFESGVITEEKMLETISFDSLISKDIVDNGVSKPEMRGLIGNPGVLRGIVVRSEEDMLKFSDLYQEHKRDTNFGWIFYAPETSPDHAPIMIKTQGFITSNGGFTSHAAILSRSWDKPCIVGVGHEDNALLESGSIITIDANNGHVYKNILPLKEGSKEEISILVNRILEHNKINMDELINENVINTQQAVLDVNNKKSWMEQYASAVKVEANPVKHSKFLDLGHKVALMVLKAQTKNHKDIKNYVNNIKSSWDTVEKMTIEQNEIKKSTSTARM